MSLWPGSAPVVDSGSIPEIVMDESFNQLDELASQGSQSILQNCVDGQSSKNSNQIGFNFLSNGITNGNNVNSNTNSVVTTIGNTECSVTNIGSDNVSDNDNNVNYYGSAVSATPFPGPVNSQMAVVTDPRKRLLSDASSSEEPIGEFSSDLADLPSASKLKPGSISNSFLALASKSKIGANKKSAKKSMGHLPAGVVSVSHLLARPKH